MGVHSHKKEEVEMGMELDIWDHLYLKMFLVENQVYRLTLDDHMETIEVLKVGEPEDMFPSLMGDTLIKRDILEMMALCGECYLHYYKGNFYIYSSEGPEIFLGDIKYTGQNHYGGPIFLINGKKCNSYKAISLAIFGEIRHNSQVKAFIEPFIIKPKPVIPGSEVNLDDFQLVKINRHLNKFYPLISYCGVEYNGVSKLKEAIPVLKRNKELLEKVLTHIGWDTQRGATRHDELIKKFDLEKVGGSYVLTNPKDPNEDVTLTSQRQVVAYIKSHGESISRDTAKRIFESL